MSAPSRVAVLVNLWVIYLVWGSTYLAIRVAVETIPPFLGAGVRFVAAGLMMALFLGARGHLTREQLGTRQVTAAALVGSLLLLGGNGVVMYAEQTVPSGLAALIIAAVPLWVVALRAIDGQPLSRLTLASVLLGFTGVALLIVPRVGGGVATLIGPLLLVGASLSWAIGSFSSQRLPLPRDPLVSTSLQMGLGGIALLGVGVVLGETRTFDPATVSGVSALALGYLIVFGSLVAFTAYTWLLHHAPVSTVATYAYVNPVIAVFLGAVLLREEITGLILAGAAVIVASVAFVVRQETLSRRPPPSSAATSATPTGIPSTGSAAARPR